MKYVRCPNSSIQGKNGEEIRLLESGIFPYISSCKSDGFWTPGDKCCPFALQLAFGVRGALEISEPGGGGGGVESGRFVPKVEMIRTQLPF